MWGWFRFDSAVRFLRASGMRGTDRDEYGGRWVDLNRFCDNFYDPGEEESDSGEG